MEVESNSAERRYPRRSFFAALLGVGAAGVGALLAVPVLRYVLFPLQTKSKQGAWSPVGPASDFATLTAPVRKTITFTQRDGWRELVSTQSVFVTKNPAGQLKVLSSICPHLGCTVSWQQARDRFVCPCHGGQFQADGQHISGPPPRGLDRLPIQIEKGQLQVQFQYFRSNVPNQEKLS